jgi:hypothetical protein
MYKTAFETASCRAYDIEEIKKKIRLANMEEGLVTPVTPDLQTSLDGILAIDSTNEDIPIFSHPIEMTIDNEDVLVIDTRPFIKINRDGSRTNTSPNDYKFLILRALLTKQWIKDPVSLRSLGGIVEQTFVRWLADSIVSKLGLDPNAQVKITVITFFYWFNLFEEGEMSERTKLNIVKKISTLTYVSSEYAVSVMDQIGPMENIREYITAIQELVESKRSESLNIGLLLTMLSGSWFGVNAKEIIGVSTEHPPTFIAIVAMALESRTYKKSLLGTKVNDLDRKNRGSEFQKSLYNLIGG